MKMTEEEFIEKYCIWCDEREYKDVTYGKDCWCFKHCFTRWGIINETANNRAKRP